MNVAVVVVLREDVHNSSSAGMLEAWVIVRRDEAVSSVLLLLGSKCGVSWSINDSRYGNWRFASRCKQREGVNE